MEELFLRAEETAVPRESVDRMSKQLDVRAIAITLAFGLGDVEGPTRRFVAKAEVMLAGAKTNDVVVLLTSRSSWRSSSGEAEELLGRRGELRAIAALCLWNRRMNSQKATRVPFHVTSILEYSRLL